MKFSVAGGRRSAAKKSVAGGRADPPQEKCVAGGR